ncbi:MAG: restriction endonuclease subunit S [Bacteroidia bacterium]|nr:restriction endonuclease subunit S [Bacteroidia bacterium]
MATETKNTKAFYNTEIPSDWEIKTLGECCLVKGEYGINAPAVEFSDDLPAYLRITDIDENGNYKINKRASVGDPNYEQFILKTGDIVFARTGATVGKTYLYKPADGTLVFAGFLIRFRTNEKLLFSQHLKYFTETKQYWDWVKTVSMRSGQPGINAEEYASLKIPLPPLPEQKAVAQVLSTADAAIHTTEKLIAQKELRKKWLMQQLLSEKRIVKNEKWGKSGVKEVLLKDIAQVTMGQSPNSEDYNTEAKGLPLIQGNADLTDRKQVVRYWTSQSNKECDAGDLIMTVRAPVGAIGLATQKSSIGRGVCSIKPKNIDYWYLYHLLVYKEEQWKKLEQGSTFTAVGSKDIFHFPLFIVHSLEEQTAIARVLQAADKEISLLKAKAEKLREQKKGLMQVLLTGKKRLNLNLQD